jgi:hypothetical protein
MTVYVMFENKENDRIVNIDKEKYEINSLHVNSRYDFICKEIFVCTAFEKSMQIYCTLTIILICKKKNIK